MGIEEVKDDLPFDTDDGDEPVPFNKKEKELLDMRDEDFVPHSWAELQQIIGKSPLAKRRSVPVQKRQYSKLGKRSTHIFNRRAYSTSKEQFGTDH